jgi:Rab11 family-interacting protein 1/2/5
VAEIVLTVLHRNFIGVDEFLGIINIPLADFDVYERPKNRRVTHFNYKVAFIYEDQK